MITLQPYSTKWPSLFLQEKSKLMKALDGGSPTIEHIGSTAIPGISAKPIIDILIGVSDVNLANLIPKIGSLEYMYQPFLMPEKELHCFEKNNTHGIRTHQIHVVQYPSCWWDKHILFRDYLRTHPEDAKAYEVHKLKLAEMHETNRTYALAKTNFCRAIDKKAYFDFAIHQPAVSTERLLGYRPQLGCFDLYQFMFQDEKFIECYGVKLSDEKILKILERDMDYWDQYGFGPYVWFEKSTQEFVGEGGLNHAIPDGIPENELTYSLSKNHWGKGYATEIGQFSLHQAFQELNLPNIVCFTSEDNSRSLNVMKKLGFKYEKDFVYAGIRHRLFRIQKSFLHETFLI